MCLFYRCISFGVFPLLECEHIFVWEDVYVLVYTWGKGYVFILQNHGRITPLGQTSEQNTVLGFCLGNYLCKGKKPETGRPQAVRLCEHRHSLSDCLLWRLKLAQHACGETYGIAWSESRIWQIETNSRKEGKYMDSAPKACLTKLNRGTSLHIPTLIRKEHSRIWLAKLFVLII